MSYYVGIVIVSFNSSTVAAITLDSIHKASNDAPYTVCVVDNSSKFASCEEVRQAVEYQNKINSHSWKFISLNKNLGFSGGNNVGIKELLKNPEITHICLLNSDTLVSDHWLDHMLEKNMDIISPVTNRADSEQSIPVEYDITIDDCLIPGTYQIKNNIFNEVNKFSKSRYTEFCGNIAEAEPTFFCVLISRFVFDRIGLLDEMFFPGGYEDDDFCYRAKAAGFRPCLARDTFVHHFGSGSFGKLDYHWVIKRANQNRYYFEQKNHVKWMPRPHRPITSFRQDCDWLLSQPDINENQKSIILKCSDTLTLYINQMHEANKNMVNAYSHIIANINDEKKRKAYFFLKKININDDWGKIVDELRFYIKTKRHSDIKCKFISQIETIEKNIFSSVNARTELKDFIDTFSEKKNYLSSFGLYRYLTILRKAIQFIIHFNGIVFFAPYPYKEWEKDGYIQRIAAIDSLFPDTQRLYVEEGFSRECHPSSRRFENMGNGAFVIRSWGGPKKQFVSRLFILACVLKSRRIYFHSVLRMETNHWGKLFHIPFLYKILDVHGVVPEEFRLYEDPYGAMIHDKWEKLAVEKASFCITVTNAMRSFLCSKYKNLVQCDFISLPIFPDMRPFLDSRPLLDGKPVVIYAGGLQRWQQVSKMCSVITKTINKYHFRFYCPTPDDFRKMLPSSVVSEMEIDEKSHSELFKIYPTCHYGFILRDDIVVNRVACPTKLVEYLAYGIIPIMDSPNIGDFCALGMQYITLNDFENNKIPSESVRYEMARKNFNVYFRLHEQHNNGVIHLKGVIQNHLDLKKMLKGCMTHDGLPRKIYLTINKICHMLLKIVRIFLAPIKKYIGKLFPRTTVIGRILRHIYAIIRPSRVRSSQLPESVLQPKENTAYSSELQMCDILVQVDNFLTGGLENVVLDLNKTCIQSGMKLVFLVLGEAGEGVERARAAGMSVVVTPYSPEKYQQILNIIKPDVVLTHYSTHGLEFCHRLNIPVIQVIHNAYVWLNGNSLDIFKEAIPYTTLYVAVSEWVKEFSTHRLGIPEDQCIVISNGVDTQKILSNNKVKARKELRAQFGFSDDDFVFLSVGSITHQKNHLAAIKAFHHALPKCPHARLIILGAAYEKPLLNEIQEYINVNNLKKYIIYAGTSKRPQDFYAMADAMLHAAFFEGGPLSLLEGVTANLPIVTSDVGLVRHLKKMDKIFVIPAPIDIMNYSQNIENMVTSQNWILQFSGAIIKTYSNPQKPNISEEVLSKINCYHIYKKYVSLLKLILLHKADKQALQSLTSDDWSQSL